IREDTRPCRRYSRAALRRGPRKRPCSDARSERKAAGVLGEGVNGITLSYPIEISLDNLGDIFVTDPGDNALQKLSSDGKLLAKWPARDKYHPISVAALPDGRTFTTEDADDGKSARVVERSPAGSELAVWR